jgi:hypothetical protein
MSYEIPAPTDKQLRAQLLYCAQLWFERSFPMDYILESLRLQIAIFVTRKNKKWYGEVEAEQGVLNAPENQDWIDEFVRKAIEDAKATNAEMSR